MASAQSASLSGGLGAEPPASYRGRALGGGSGDEAPLKLKAFRLLNFPWNSKIYPVFHILLLFQSSDNLLFGIHNTAPKLLALH